MKVVVQGKKFHTEALWEDNYPTDFTSLEEQPILYRYFIDGVELTKDKFEAEYNKARNERVA